MRDKEMDIRGVGEDVKARDIGVWGGEVEGWMDGGG